MGVLSVCVEMTLGLFSAGQVLDSLDRDAHGLLLVFLSPEFTYLFFACLF